MISVTATELPRIIPCNGSIKMEGFISDEPKDDTLKKAGDAVHWLAETAHKGEHSLDELIDRKANNGVYITREMVDHVTDYLNGIGKGGYIEYKTSFQGVNWEIRSRADHIKYLDNVLYVDDLKYGWSIVEPRENWTLLAHAIGFCMVNNVAPKEIVLTIYQPRPYHTDGAVRSWKLNYNQLQGYYNQLSSTLTNLKDELNTGDWCRNCKAIATCPARLKAELNAIEASELRFENEISNDMLSFRLDHLKRAIKVLEQNYDAYEEIAIHRIKNAQVVNNYSMENQLTNRNWKAGMNAEFLHSVTGQDLTVKELISPSAAERAGVSKEVVAALTERNSKGSKLVRIEAHKKAEKLFNQPKGN